MAQVPPTSHTSHAALADLGIADSAAFLQKPFTVETLLAKVREHLAG